MRQDEREEVTRMNDWTADDGMLMFIILIRLSIEINPRHSHCAYQQRVCQDAGAK